MQEGFRIWANPSSPHAEGRKAKQALEDARDRVKKALGWHGEVIFTSGASEAAAIAMTRARGDRRFVSTVEHDAIVGATVDPATLLVEEDGTIDLTGVHLPPKSVVAVQHINSETGSLQDIKAVAELVHRDGGLLICDCAQSAAKYAIPLSCDMAIISAHKFGGPIGVGALLVKKFAMLSAMGGHERGYRRGTENLPAILGMAAALECVKPAPWPNGPNILSYYPDEAESYFVYDLIPMLEQAGAKFLSTSLKHPTLVAQSIAMPGISASAQLMRFDMEGIAISAGSACSSGTLKVSRVLENMCIDPKIAESSIRLSLGWNSTAKDLEAFGKAWLKISANTTP